MKNRRAVSSARSFYEIRDSFQLHLVKICNHVQTPSRWVIPDLHQARCFNAVSIGSIFKEQ